MALHHAMPREVIELEPLKQEPKDAKSTAIVKCEDFEAIRLIIPAGKIIPSHKVSGTITLHCLEGHIELGLDDKTIELKSNDWVYLESEESHSVVGIKDSSLLLTIIFDTRS